jgi:hypothetical protein
MFDPVEIIRALNRHNVRYVIIGGFAATLYGCPEQTFDLDIVFDDSEENRVRLLTALNEIGAQWDVPLTPEILRRQPLFALNTRAGDLDIFSIVPGINSFAELNNSVRDFSVHGETVPVAGLSELIATKEAAADPNPRKRSTLEYLKALHSHGTDR